MIRFFVSSSKRALRAGDGGEDQVQAFRGKSGGGARGKRDIKDGEQWCLSQSVGAILPPPEWKKGFCLLLGCWTSEGDLLSWDSGERVVPHLQVADARNTGGELPRT